MAEGTKVGDLYYDVTLDTGGAVAASRRMREENQRTGSSFDALGAKVTKIVSAIQVYAAALALLKAAQAADDVRLLGSRVEVAAGSVERGAAAMRELVAIAERSRSSVADNAQVFARLNQSMLQLGGTQRDTLQLTELLGQAITVSGASAQEKSAAMIQFAQAIGSGKLAGDELRSLLENAPYLMRQLADGLGVPIGALRQMGEEGKLTSDVVIKALGKAASQIEADFKRMPVTLDSALTVSADALRRLNAAIDEASGKTLILTGITQGAGEAFDLLAIQINQASEKQDALGKSTAIQQWKDRAVTAISFVIDAGEVVVRTFQAIGLVIYNVAATAAQAATGDFAAARSQIQGMVQDLTALETRQFRGAAIRQAAEALATGTDGSDRLDRMARGGVGLGGRSTLGSTTPGKADKFDDVAYLAGLVKDTEEGYAKIDAIEREALAKNEALLKQGKITRATYEKAITLIQLAAANERRDLGLKEAEETRSAIEKRGKEAEELEARSAKARADVLIAVTFDAERAIAATRDEVVRQAEDSYRRGKLTFEEAEAAKVSAALSAADQFRQIEQRRQQFQLETLGMRAGTGGVSDQVALIEAEMAQRLQAAEQMMQQGLITAQMYADREVEIVADAERRKTAARFAADQLALQSAASTFSSLATMAQAFGGKQDRTARALFAVSKAFAIADAIVKIQQGVASAMSLPYPANLAAAAGVAAQGANIVGIIKGTNYGGGRQYGGPTSAGTLYRVNEAGRPEMFTAANGAQYMLPTSSGNVTPASEIAGGGVHWTINVNGAPPGTSTRVDPQSRRIDIDLAVQESASQIIERRGPMWAALKTTNVRGQQ